MKYNLFYILLIISTLFIFTNCENLPKEQSSANLLLDRQKKDIDRFEEAIEAFEKADSIQFPEKNGILFTGSSSIRFWQTLKEDMSPLPVINRGFGGSTIPEVIHYADRIVFPYQPKMIVFYCGENDIHEENLPALVFQNFKKFTNQVSEKLPETKIVFLSMKPSLNRWSEWKRFKKGNEMIRQFAENMDNLEYIEVSEVMLTTEGKPSPEIFVEDGLHMNAKGYEAWTELIKPQIENWWKEEI